MRGAHRERAAGVNVLLHGPPGSGKSQLVRSVARALGVPLYRVPDTAPSGELLKGPKRLAALAAMQCLLPGHEPALVLFDEIEDAFPWSFESGWLRRGSGTDKARTNRLLEENVVPCIWVGNGIEHLDPAFVRRFALVVEVAAPPRQVRERLLCEYASGLAVPPELSRRLAGHAWVVPADAAPRARARRRSRDSSRARSAGLSCNAPPVTCSTCTWAARNEPSQTCSTKRRGATAYSCWTRPRGCCVTAARRFEALDPAALRRFALRVEFLPLSAGQKLLLFERTAQRLGVQLGGEAVALAQRRLARLSLLTPGDYASLLRGQLLLGAASVESLLGDLERAHAEKRAERRIGFR